MIEKLLKKFKKADEPYDDINNYFLYNLRSFIPEDVKFYRNEKVIVENSEQPATVVDIMFVSPASSDDMFKRVGNSMPSGFFYRVMFEKGSIGIQCSPDGMLTYDVNEAWIHQDLLRKL